jgi:hypothetical protein
MSPADIPPKLGEWLLGQGLISHDQLRIALIEQQASGLPLGQQLVALGFVTAARASTGTSSPSVLTSCPSRPLITGR